jgi:DNA-binding NarL/FixJ family response regulator
VTDQLDETKPLLLTSPDRLRELRKVTRALRSQRDALRESVRVQLERLRAHHELLAEVHGALQNHDASAGAAKLEAKYGFTPREAEVAILLAAGRGNAAIANTLKISPHTARHHTQHVLAKLGVHSRAAAGARLRRLA